MTIQITMPALSPTMEEGNLAKWHVKAGDRIAPGQVIAEIETDKATMEVEAVDEGVIAEILVPEGSQGVKVNTPIAVLTGEAQAAAPPPQAAPPKAETVAAVRESVVLDRRPPAGEGAGAPKQDPNGGDRPPSSPLARRMAEQARIDLARIAGTGPHGRIVKRDVEAAMQAPQASRQLTVNGAQGERQQTQAPVPYKSLESQGLRPGTYDLVPLDLMRKTIARRMTESFRDVPHFPLSIDIEIDGLLKARGDINKRFADSGVKISVNDMCIKAAALALKMVPEANASYTPDGIAQHHHADIAVAVSIPGGLITPIIFAAETKGLAQISHEMADLAERARNKKLKPEEYQGGTFSLSNMGMMGVKSFASIINEPHGMIMSIGAGEKRPIVKNDALAIATMMSVTVTCDHRVVDGALGAAFLKAFRGFLEDPMAMLL
jgi:pyruvate dehydrogenase E2 component (dihydrolipoamide acetyltransferase)